MKEYPVEHKEIVDELLDGKFIIYPNQLFSTLQRHEDEYTKFFKHSFEYKLNIESDFAYLSSKTVNENRTRDFTLFLAILCRELDYSGKNFKEKVEDGTFNINDTFELLRQSSKWEILERTSVSDFEKFIKSWGNKNLLKVDGMNFKFTKAIKLFFTFAVDLAEEKLKDKNDKE